MAIMGGQLIGVWTYTVVVIPHAIKPVPSTELMADVDSPRAIYKVIAIKIGQVEILLFLQWRIINIKPKGKK